MDHADGNRQYKSEIRTDENGESYIIADDGSKIYISWTEKGIGNDGSVIYSVVAAE